jgi:hypothetical protein
LLPRRVAAAAVVCASLAHASGCLPPPIDDEEPLEAGLIFIPDQLKPANQTVTLSRTAGQSVTFDVRAAYEDPEGLALTYYWYVDWPPPQPDGEPAEPLDVVGEQLFFDSCGEYDFLEEGGTRPDRRRIMVVVTNRPLEDPSLAFLGAAEGARLEMDWWLIDFQGTTCPF